MSWQSCYSAAVEAEAYVVKGYLEQFGVPCLIEQSPFVSSPFCFSVLGETRVLVREDWVHIARGLIRGRQGVGRSPLPAISGARR